MKYMVAFALICLSGVAFGQDLSKPIDYTTKAKATRLVLDDLSKLAKVKLQADRPLEEEPLIVRVKGVPLQTLMDKMADVYAADWVDHHGYWDLERSDEKTEAIKKSILDKRTQAFQSSIDALVQLEKNNPPMDAAHALTLAQGFADEKVKNGTYTTTMDSFLAQSQLPGMRFAIKVLASMDARELASIPVNTRVVYSSSPNAMQRALPTIAQQDVQEFLNERKLFHDAAQQVHASDDSIMSFLGIDSDPVGAKPARLLCTTMTNGGSQLILQFAMYDDKGVAIMDDSENLGMPWKQLYEGRARRAKIRLQKDGYALDPLVVELCSQQRSKNPKPISAELRKKLLDVADNDPLSFGASDILLRGAEQENLNVIALGDDQLEQAADAAAWSGKGITSLDKFATYILGTQSIMQTSEGWIVIKPIDPIETANTRFPRTALQEYFDMIVSDGYASLETRAKLAAGASRSTPSTWPDIVTPLLFNSADSQSFYALDALRLYGTLSDEQLATLRNTPLVLRPSDLGDDQKSMVNDIVFNDFFGSLMDSGDRNGQGVTTNEPTDVLPNGLTTDTTVTFTTNEKDVFFTQQESPGGVYLTPHQMEELPWLVMSAKHPPQSPWAYPMHITGFKSGKQRTVEVKVQLNARFYTQQDLSENHPSDGPLMDADAFIASLPDDVRKKILDQMAMEERRISQAATAATQAPPPSSPPLHW